MFSPVELVGETLFGLSAVSSSSSSTKTYSVDQEWTVFAVFVFIIDIILLFVAASVFFFWEFVRIVISEYRSRTGRKKFFTHEMMELVFLRDAKKLSACAILGYRLLCFVFFFGTLIGIEIDYVNNEGGNFFLLYQYFTLASYLILVIHYGFSSIVTMLYLAHLIVSDDGKRRIPLWEHIVIAPACWLASCSFTLTITRAITVDMLYWVLLVPMQLIGISSGTFHLTFFGLSEHLFNGIAVSFELFLMRSYEIFASRGALVTASCAVWLLFSTILTKTHLTPEFAYGGILSYDTSWWAVIVRYLSFVGLLFIFSILYFFAKIRFVLVGRMDKVDDDDDDNKYRESKMLESCDNDVLQIDEEDNQAISIHDSNGKGERLSLLSGSSVDDQEMKRMIDQSPGISPAVSMVSLRQEDVDLGDDDEMSEISLV